jgi:hypothetical protein
VATVLKDGQAKGTGFTLVEARVKDDTAEVAATLTDKESKATPAIVLLRREEKQWRVWGLRFQADNGTELTLDLEHPERLVGEALGLAFGELAKGLEGLSKNAEKTGRALGEALGGFVKGLTEGMEKTAPKTAPKTATGDPLAPPVVK